MHEIFMLFTIIIDAIHAAIFSISYDNAEAFAFACIYYRR